MPLIAAEWYGKPTISMHSEYNDNIFLRPGKNPAAYGYQATFLGIGGVRSAITNIALTAQVDIFRYGGQKSLDREYYTVGMNADYLINERNKVGLQTNFISDTTLGSELNSTGLFGIGFRQIGRERIYIAPSWSYQLSDRKTIKTNYGHEEVTYESSGSNNTLNAIRNGDGFNSYITDSVGLVFSDYWNARLRYDIGFNALNYDLISINRQTKSYSLSLGINYTYSDTLNFNAMGGIRRTDTDADGITQTSYGPIFNIGLQKQFDRAEVSISYQRSTNPSGIGLFLNIDNVLLTGEYRLTEKISLSISGALISTNSVSDFPGFKYDRTYYSIEPMVTWNINKQLSLAGSYRYQTQEFTQGLSGIEKTKADSNGIFLNLDYHFDVITTNRY